MISTNCFTEEWILRVKGDGRSDQRIIERQIYALHLLEELSKELSGFIFKGGTALSLLSSEFPRFSVDIDVLVNPKDKSFFTIEILRNILSHSQFTRVEENIRTPKHDIDKKHYEFYYDGVYGKGSYIILDVVFAESHYSTLCSLEVKNHLLELTGKPTLVDIPSVHDFLPDKLCAFAPTTIGKRLGEGRDVEVIKQMYDVSFLFDHYPLSPSFHRTYQAIASHEIRSRKLHISYEDTALDTILTSLNIISEGEIDKTRYQILREAIKRFASYVSDYSFNVEKARLCAINTLYAAALVLTEGHDRFVEIVDNQKDFLSDYVIFKSTKRWLRVTSLEQHDKFEHCLKVLSHYEIRVR